MAYKGKDNLLTPVIEKSKETEKDTRSRMAADKVSGVAAGDSISIDVAEFKERTK